MTTRKLLHELIADTMGTGIDEESGSATVPTWDSMRELMLASMLESEYGIALSIDEMLDLHSVQSIRRILDARGIRA